MPEPVGNLLDSLGVVHDPDEAELVCAAVVLMKVITPDGRSILRIVDSEGLDWIDRLGMVEAAAANEHGGLGCSCRDV